MTNTTEYFEITLYAKNFSGSLNSEYDFAENQDTQKFDTLEEAEAQVFISKKDIIENDYYIGDKEICITKISFNEIDEEFEYQEVFSVEF